MKNYIGSAMAGVRLRPIGGKRLQVTVLPIVGVGKREVLVVDDKNIEYEENNLFDGSDAVRVSARRRDVGLCAGTDSALDFGIFTERHFGAFHGHLLSGGGERDGD